MTWRLNSGLNDLCFLMTRPFLPLPRAGDPVCYSNISVQSMGCSAAEDTILAKLEWSKLSGSERQFNDALNIAKLQMGNLDRAYLEEWARQLDISGLLVKLLHEAE